MQTTNISWADYSWNPVTGCSKISSECRNCYAEALHLQQAEQEDPPEYVTGKPWFSVNAEANVQMHPDRLDAPFEFGFPEGPGRVFVGSMTDLFHDQVDPEFVQQVLAVCQQFPEHIWIFLTKRPYNARDSRLDWPANAWVGTSVGLPNTTGRLDQLRKVDAPARWLSAEPLIEPLGDVDLEGIDWVVVGGESAPAEDRREMDHEWARDLLRQCRAAGVPFYFKQSSGRYPETGTALTVERELGGTTVYEQREIREYPGLPDVTRQAREATE